MNDVKDVEDLEWAVRSYDDGVKVYVKIGEGIFLPVIGFGNFADILSESCIFLEVIKLTGVLILVLTHFGFALIGCVISFSYLTKRFYGKRERQVDQPKMTELDGDRIIEKVKDRIYEKLAAIEHERWGSWQQHMHSRGVSSNNGLLFIGADIERWERQIRTQYSELSEAEKDSDRHQVDKYWPLIEETVQEVIDSVVRR